MKKTALTFAISFLISSIAFAGSEAKEIVPQPVAPAPCFDGWYFGFHAGGVFEQGSNHDTFTQALVSEREEGTTFFFDAGRDSGDDQWGGEGGVQVGRNFQRGSFVFGLEADFSGSLMGKNGGSAHAFANETLDDDAFARAGTTTTTTLNWYTTVRPRLGYVFWNDRVMAFATGGLAVGQADFDIHTNLEFVNESPTERAHLLRNGDEDPQVGWTVGGGLEFCVTPHVLLTLTYLYVDLGERDVRTHFGPIFSEDDRIDFVRGRATSDLTYHVIQGGVSFKF